MRGKYSKEWLRPDELKQLLSLPGIAEKYEIWILLMYTPALRVIEAINIRLRDLDVNNQCVERAMMTLNFGKLPVTSLL